MRARHLTVRWRLALTSASLTFVILLLFAWVIGVFTARQVHANFDNDLRLATADLQAQIRVAPSYTGGFKLQGPPDLLEAASAGGAEVRVVGASGDVLVQTAMAPKLPPPAEDLQTSDGYRVVSRPLFATSAGGPVAFVQYAKRESSVNATIGRVNGFLTVGVLGGTALALLAGLAVARRAMSPIVRLTGAAKRVAQTRDPSVVLPKPKADDEVADLARTLEEMLGALDAARGETEAALARQREFVADASHELRTPLTSVLANLELLEASLTGEDREIAESATRSSRRMRRLVGDLLLLARADAGREAPRRSVDLGAVVGEAAAEAAPVAADHDVSVEAPRGLLVEGSPDDLHRLVLNLIENAVAHTPPGTAVHVDVRSDGPLVRLVVADDGPGVSDEVRERIFERFVRGGGEGARGSGLGLAIVDAVARTHGGAVRLAEDDGTPGARFTVELPASIGAEAGADAPTAQAVPVRS